MNKRHHPDYTCRFDVKKKDDGYQCRDVGASDKRRAEDRHGGALIDYEGRLTG